MLLIKSLDSQISILMHPYAVTHSVTDYQAGIYINPVQKVQKRVKCACIVVKPKL